MNKKIALIIIDNLNIDIDPSFYVIDRTPFKLNHEKYLGESEVVTNIAMRSTWAIPFINNGYFLNYNEGLIDIKPNIIFLISDYRFEINRLKEVREKYPNSLIIAYTKEKTPEYYFPLHRQEFFNLCDKVALPYRKSIRDFVSNEINKKVYKLPYPYDIERIRNKFYIPQNERKNKILAWVNPRRGQNNIGVTWEFAQQLGDKYNYEIIKHHADNFISWENWLKQLASCKFIVNLDNSSEIGQIPIECAILGVMHLGSNLDAAQILFPDTATNDLEKLDAAVYELPENIIKKAYENVIKRHSFEAVKKRLEKIIND